MMWRLRRATAADSASVAMVAAASFLETFAGVLDGADIVAHCATNTSSAKFAVWADDPASVVTLAEHPIGAAPIGYTVLTTPDLPIDTLPTDVELRRIYTLALAAGSGLGAMLMATAIDDARTFGATRLVLGVFAGNARARAFYERQGFTPIAERRFLVGKTWCDDLVYARTI